MITLPSFQSCITDWLMITSLLYAKFIQVEYINSILHSFCTWAELIHHTLFNKTSTSLLTNSVIVYVLITVKVLQQYSSALHSSDQHVYLDRFKSGTWALLLLGIIWSSFLQLFTISRIQGSAMMAKHSIINQQRTIFLKKARYLQHASKMYLL